MPMRTLVRYLDKNRVGYMTINHPYAVTAQEIAEKAHISGRELAKTVMLKVDAELIMAVLPANGSVDLDAVRSTFMASTVEIAGEEDFGGLFPECEIGAMPPFGNLFGLRVYVDSDLAGDNHIAFTAGTHREVIMMPYRDYERLVRPAIMSFGKTGVA